MEKSIVQHKIMIPDVTEYEKSYPRVPCNTIQKKAIFKLLTLPENISRAIILAQELKISPIVVFEERLSRSVKMNELVPLNHHEKQFVGTVICVIMESNGWEKTGKKQRFSKGIFKSAEMYKQK